MKPGDGFNALIKILYTIFFIWGMEIIAVKTKTHENYFYAKLFFKY